MLEECDLAIEAVDEDRGVKAQVLRRIEAVLPTARSPQYIGLTISGLAGVLSRPERFIGLHFFSPRADAVGGSRAIATAASSELVSGTAPASRAAAKPLSSHRSGLQPAADSTAGKPHPAPERPMRARLPAPAFRSMPARPFAHHARLHQIAAKTREVKKPGPSHTTTARFAEFATKAAASRSVDGCETPGSLPQRHPLGGGEESNPYEPFPTLSTPSNPLIVSPDDLAIGGPGSTLDASQTCA